MKDRFSKLSRAIIWILALFTLLQPTIAQSERILNYEVLIEVNKDRSIDVRENILVLAQGDKIKRGIYRVLPRERTFVNGRTKPIRYNIKAVLKDGQSAPYFTRRESSDEYLYVGRKEVLLKPGQYQYTLEFHIPNQVEQLKDIDEIYWNAIGQFWDFPIDQASCLLKLPDDIAAIQTACYTGRYGSSDKNCTIKTVNGGNEILFQTTRPLRVKEGMSIGVGFEKGVVQAPSFIERFGSAIILGFVALVLLLYFIFTWNKYGIDPPKPTPYPMFASPKGYSPASISFIAKEKYQSNKIASSIINLAINGYLKIEEVKGNSLFSSKKNYRLIKLKGSDGELYKEDKAFFDNLFRNSTHVSIDGDYDPIVQNAYQLHKGSVLAQHEDFVTEGNNRKFLVLPIIISFLAVVLAVIMMNRNGTSMDGLGLILFSGVFIGLPIFVLISIFSSSRSYSGFLKVILVPFLFVFIAAGGMPMLMGLSEIKGLVYSGLNGIGLNVIALGLFVPLALVALFIYAYLIKQPTVEKLQLQSEIEGFKMYLEMAEKDRMNLLNPPDRTPEHFEAMLPFAFALGVEHKWSAIFKSILEKAAYQPQWSNNPYIYTTNNFSTGFSNAMSRASTPPPPSSSGGGSGGGGFSGGGGGGGGGGGW